MTVSSLVRSPKVPERLCAFNSLGGLFADSLDKEPEPRHPRARWAVLGLAAVLALALLAPTLLRNLDGAAGRSTPVRSGQVVAVRFGEIPGGTVTLEAGCYDRSTGTCH